MNPEELILLLGAAVAVWYFVYGPGASSASTASAAPASTVVATSTPNPVSATPVSTATPATYASTVPGYGVSTLSPALDIMSATQEAGLSVNAPQGTTAAIPAASAAANQAFLMGTVQAYAQAGGTSLTSLQPPDVWTTYLLQVEPSFPSPTDAQLFPSTGSAPVTFQQWWTAILPFLPAAYQTSVSTASAGISGLGYFRRGGWAA